MTWLPPCCFLCWCISIEKPIWLTKGQGWDRWAGCGWVLEAAISAPAMFFIPTMPTIPTGPWGRAQVEFHRLGGFADPFKGPRT